MPSTPRGSSAAEVAGPGFLNLWLTPAWYAEACAPRWARAMAAARPPRRERINVEYVSANPTGRLTVGSARNAAYGDSLARLLEHSPATTSSREYYFNDAGRQVETLRPLAACARAWTRTCPRTATRARTSRSSRGGSTCPTTRRSTSGRGPGSRRCSRTSATRSTRFRCRFDVWTNEAQTSRGRRRRRRARARRRGGHTSRRTARCGSARPSSATTRTGRSCAPKRASRRTWPPTSRTSSTSSTAATSARSTCSAPTTTATCARLKAAAAALGLRPRADRDAALPDRLDRRGRRAAQDLEAPRQHRPPGRPASRRSASTRSLLPRAALPRPTIEIDLELAREQGPKNPVYYVQYGHARIASILRKADVDAFDSPTWPPSPRAPEAAPDPPARRLPDRLRRGDRAARAAPDRRLRPYRLASDFHVFYRSAPS